MFKEDDFAKLIAEQRELNGEISRHSADVPDDLDDAIRRHVRRVFEKYACNVSKAAAALKITRTTLRKWITEGEEQ